MDISSNKDEEENSMHNTVVLFSNSDKFTLHQVRIIVTVFSFCFSAFNAKKSKWMSLLGTKSYSKLVGLYSYMFSECSVWHVLKMGCFLSFQDMCVVCGSFGQGAEGRLLACSQCGQCYHPYCVSIKVSAFVHVKKWLDYTFFSYCVLIALCCLWFCGN